MTDARACRGCRFPAEVILWPVWWSLQFPLSYRELERRLADRGVAVDPTTLDRWVQRFGSRLDFGHFAGGGSDRTRRSAPWWRDYQEA